MRKCAEGLAAAEDKALIELVSVGSLRLMRPQNTPMGVSHAAAGRKMALHMGRARKKLIKPATFLPLGLQRNRARHSLVGPPVLLWDSLNESHLSLIV